MNYPEYVRYAISKLEECGHEAFIVGGGLRDMLLGREPNDFDIATSATPEQTLKTFSGFHTIKTGLQHGTVTVIIDSHPLEITTYRIDGKYSDSRHPESVCFTKRIEEDLSRRDFTINALAYNKNSGLIDAFGGKKDLDDRIIRAVGDAHTRMNEDALRIMRALRFSAQLSFSIESDTYKALGNCAHLLSKISGERKGAELLKLVCAPSAEDAVRDMLKTGVWAVISPQFTPSERSVASLGKLDPLPHERLAALLYDCDAETANDFLHTLRYSEKLISSTLRLISGEYAVVSSDTDVRKFIIFYGELSESMVRLADALGESGYPTKEKFDIIMPKDFCKSISELQINGNELSDLGFRGKEIGRALNELFELVTADPKLNKKDLLLKEAKKMKEKIQNGKDT